MCIGLDDYSRLIEHTQTASGYRERSKAGKYWSDT
jgi:hypothetical protein